MEYFTGVPDSLLKNFCAYVTDHTLHQNHVIAANEGGAVALAAGHHLATGKIPMVYMQNSGQGNAINPLTSLADAEVYGIPMLLLLGWRGEPGKHDEPQHLKKGRIMQSLLDSMEIPYAVLPADIDGATEVLDRAISNARGRSAPFALIVPAKTFGPYQLANQSEAVGRISRESGIELVATAMPEDAVIISTTGMASRELFEIRKRNGQPSERDFLTVGSMGHASQIALGVAEGRPDLPIYCLDGDGALIMHMGGLAIIGQRQPRNFKHILLNNNAHDSVGGQPTAASAIDIPALALACGYKQAWRAESHDEICEGLKRLADVEGPSLLEIVVSKGARADIGRPTHTPQDAKKAFMEALRSS